MWTLYSKNKGIALSIQLTEEAPAFYINQTVADIISLNSPHLNMTVESNSDIILNASTSWNSPASLTLQSQKDIILKPGSTITVMGGGYLYLKAGIENPNGMGRVVFEDEEKKQITCNKDSKIHIYYNPTPDNADPRYSHKYHNPYGYYTHLKSCRSEKNYMLVNDIYDLQNIECFLSGDYALSRDIDATVTKEWNHGKGFNPISIMSGPRSPWPFSGSFDGNNFLIKNLYINRSKEDMVGLFGYIFGYTHTKIANLNLQNSVIIGKHYVGGIAGVAEHVNFENIKILDTLHVEGNELVGAIAGTASEITFSGVTVPQNLNESIIARGCCSLYVGAVEDSIMFDSYAPGSAFANVSQCIACETNMLWQCEANIA